MLLAPVSDASNLLGGRLIRSPAAALKGVAMAVAIGSSRIMVCS